MNRVASATPPPVNCTVAPGWKPDPVMVTVVASEPKAMTGGEMPVTTGPGASTVKFTWMLVCGSIWMAPAYTPGLRLVGSAVTDSVAGVVVPEAVNLSQLALDVGANAKADELAKISCGV